MTEESRFDSRDQICLHVGFHYIAQCPLCHAGLDKLNFAVDRQKDKPDFRASFAEFLSGLDTPQHRHGYVCYDHIGIKAHPCGKKLLSVPDGPYDFKACAQKDSYPVKYDRIVVGKEHPRMFQRLSPRTASGTHHGMVATPEL